MTSRHELTPADILPWAEYAKDRAEHRKRLTAIKRNRRVEVGPYVTFYFENFDTMWLQVQEMLHIEKGGEAQLADELAAYNPLIPKGKELVATFMIEIDDALRRARVLAQLGGIEETAFIEVGGERVARQGRGRPGPHHRRRQGEQRAIRALPLHRRADRGLQGAERARDPGPVASQLQPYGRAVGSDARGAGGGFRLRRQESGVHARAYRGHPRGQAAQSSSWMAWRVPGHDGGKTSGIAGGRACR